jgi:hypothetical protein
MASLDDIKKVISDNNTQLRKDITGDIMDQIQGVVTSTVDKRLAAHEEKMFAQLRSLNERTAALEKAQAVDEAGSKRPRSVGPASGKSTQSSTSIEEFKVKAIGFPVDTRKADAECTLVGACATQEGYIEAYMPGSRNDFAFVKFDSDSARRRFLNRTQSDDLVVTHAGQKIRFLRCRTIEQKDKTKHIDKFKRAIIETIKAKYPDVADGSFKTKIETGMIDGGVAWIGDARVAEMVSNGGGGKVFTINPEKVTGELKKLGWNIDGAEVVAAYRAAME